MLGGTAEALHDAEAYLHISSQGGEAFQVVALAAGNVSDDIHALQQSPVAAIVIGYFKCNRIKSTFTEGLIVKGQSCRGSILQIR